MAISKVQGRRIRKISAPIFSYPMNIRRPIQQTKSRKSRAKVTLMTQSDEPVLIKTTVPNQLTQTSTEDEMKDVLEFFIDAARNDPTSVSQTFFVFGQSYLGELFKNQKKFVDKTTEDEIKGFLNKALDLTRQYTVE